MTHASTTGSHMEAELRSQPQTWAIAAGLREEQSLLPAAGERIAVVGCGTSWFMAQSYAVLRERAGHGVTDAYAASEAFVDADAFRARDYDAIVAITRSGTTTEVLELLDGLRSAGNRARTVGIVGDPDTPLVERVDTAIRLPFADEQSVVQTRFATTALALVRASLGHDLAAAIDQAAAAVEEDLDDALIEAEQYAFLGTGWTVGLAHEAALKMREAAQAWSESYPAMDYRHGPIAVAGPKSLVWMLGTPPPGLVEQIEDTGAVVVTSDLDPLAQLVQTQRSAVAVAAARGLDPDEPRGLTRSVVLT